MRCPLLSQYAEALGDAFGLFRTLGEVVPVRDACGEPTFFSGNHAAVFRVECEGRTFALKCYTRIPEYAEQVYGYLESRPLPYLARSRWLKDEFYVYDAYDRGRYYPVAEMEWIDGRTLGREVADLCRRGDREALSVLARKFDRMALWLLEQEFAHGDLKQDNIMVTSRGGLKLVDPDGLYIPALAGRRCALIGSPAYQHPARDERFFCKAVDDYPIALISLSLHALSSDPELYFTYSDRENLLFDAADVCRGRSPLFEELMRRWLREGNLPLYVLGGLLRSAVPQLPELPRALEALSGTGTVLSDDCEVIDGADSRCAVVRRRGLYGYADLEEERFVLEPVYSEAMPFSEGLGLVRAQGRYAFVDGDGRLRIDCAAYEGVSPFRDGRALVVSEGRYGFIDRSGRMAVAPVYDFASGFREGLALVRRGERYGYIDPDGKIVLPILFDRATRFVRGVASVERRGVVWKVIDLGAGV